MKSAGGEGRERGELVAEVGVFVRGVLDSGDFPAPEQVKTLEK